MPGIGVVLNPFSKKYKNDRGKLDHMAFIIGDKASCKPTEDIADVHRVAEEFKSRDIDLLAISGGDGTIHCTLTVFIKVYGTKPMPKVTFLRGGTLNTIAASMGIKGSTEKLLSNLLVKYHEDKTFDTHKLRLTRINDDYGCIFGLGVIYNFMDFYYKNPTVNPVIALKTLLQSVGSALINGKTIQNMCKRFDAEVIVNGKRWPFANWCALFSGSIRQIGFDFNVFRHMLTQNEKFHALGLSMSPQEIVLLLKKFHDGVAPDSPELVEDLADNMEIHCAEAQPYTIDGDMLPATTDFTISQGPEIAVVV